VLSRAVFPEEGDQCLVAAVPVDVAVALGFAAPLVIRAARRAADRGQQPPGLVETPGQGPVDDRRDRASRGYLMRSG